MFELLEIKLQNVYRPCTGNVRGNHSVRNVYTMYIFKARRSFFRSIWGALKHLFVDIHDDEGYQYYFLSML